MGQRASPAPPTSPRAARALSTLSPRRRPTTATAAASSLPGVRPPAPPLPCLRSSPLRDLSAGVRSGHRGLPGGDGDRRRDVDAARPGRHRGRPRRRRPPPHVGLRRRRSRVARTPRLLCAAGCRRRRLLVRRRVGRADALPLHLASGGHRGARVARVRVPPLARPDLRLLLGGQLPVWVRVRRRGRRIHALAERPLVLLRLRLSELAAGVRKPPPLRRRVDRARRLVRSYARRETEHADCRAGIHRTLGTCT